MNNDIDELKTAFRGFPVASQRRMLHAMDEHSQSEALKLGATPGELEGMSGMELSRLVADLSAATI